VLSKFWTVQQTNCLLNNQTMWSNAQWLCEVQLLVYFATVLILINILRDTDSFLRHKPQQSSSVSSNFISWLAFISYVSSDSSSNIHFNNKPFLTHIVKCSVNLLHAHLTLTITATWAPILLILITETSKQTKYVNWKLTFHGNVRQAASSRFSADNVTSECSEPSLSPAYQHPQTPRHRPSDPNSLTYMHTYIWEHTMAPFTNTHTSVPK